MATSGKNSSGDPETASSNVSSIPKPVILSPVSMDMRGKNGYSNTGGGEIAG